MTVDEQPVSQDSQQLGSIARAQRYLIICILINLMAYATLLWAQFSSLDEETSLTIRWSAWVIYLFANIAAAICLFQLTRLLYGLRTAILSILVMVFPFLNLLLLLAVNVRATGTLRENGLKVGFFGVRPADIKKIGDE